MNLTPLKSSPEELASTWQQKYNALVGKVIYDVKIEGGFIKFYTTDSATPLSIKLTGGGGDEETDYTSNSFVSDGDTHAQAISSLDAILAALVPPTAESLNNKIMTINVAVYTAILSREGDPAWLANGTLAEGTLFTGVIKNPFYALQSPSQGNTFKVGRKDFPVGTVFHNVNGSDINDVAVVNGSASNTRNSSEMSVYSGAYSSIWQKGVASINYHQTIPYTKHVLRHESEPGTVFGGESTGLRLWYDDFDVLQVSLNSPLIAEPNVVTKMLSGIAHYGKGTVLNFTFNLGGIYHNCYHPTAVAGISSPAFDSISLQPTSVPRSADIFFVNKNITLSRDYSSGSSLGTMTAAGYRPDGTSRTATVNMSRRVCAYNNVATNTQEYFLDESYRLVADNTLAFNSQLALPPGEAQVRNGALVYGDVDYPGKSGVAKYQRFVLKSATSNGAIVLNNVARAAISPYGTGDVNLLLKLESGVYFDLGVSFGFGGNGSSPATARGGRADDRCTASSTGFTFGLLNTSDPGNNDKYRICLYLNDTPGARSVQMTGITTA